MIRKSPSNQDLGYVLLPPRRPCEPGYAGIDAILASTPSRKHFDPEAAHLSVAVEERIAPLVVEHPWNGLDNYRICAGPMILIDRRGKHLDAFTFGGDLQVQVHEDRTNLEIRSAAPLLVSFSLHTIPALLADEAEIVLAQSRAATPNSPEEFERHLASADPLELYYACLEAIAQRFEIIPQHDDFIVQFKYTLKHEIDNVAGLLPGRLRARSLIENL